MFTQLAGFSPLSLPLPPQDIACGVNINRVQITCSFQGLSICQNNSVISIYFYSYLRVHKFHKLIGNWFEKVSMYDDVTAIGQFCLNLA